MDVDAGATGSREELATSLFFLTHAIASGRRSKGEATGHHQLQIWRNWPRDPSCDPGHALGPGGGGGPADLVATPAGTLASAFGRPLALAPLAASMRELRLTFEGLPAVLGGRSPVGECAQPPGLTSEWVALVLPTSLCSAEVRSLIGVACITDLFRENLSLFGVAHAVAGARIARNVARDGLTAAGARQGSGWVLVAWPLLK